MNDWGYDATPDPEKGLIPNEGGTLWLVELVAPFHTAENKHREQMLSDLMKTSFLGKAVKLMQINPTSSQKEELSICGVN